MFQLWTDYKHRIIDLSYVYIMYIHNYFMYELQTYYLPFFLGQKMQIWNNTMTRCALPGTTSSYQFMRATGQLQRPPPNVAAKCICHASTCATGLRRLPCSGGSQCHFRSITFSHCPYFTMQVLFLSHCSCSWITDNTMHHAEANFVRLFVGQVALVLDTLVGALCHLTCDILAVANLLYTAVCHGMWFFTAPHGACLASVSNPTFKWKHSSYFQMETLEPAPPAAYQPSLSSVVCHQLCILAVCKGGKGANSYLWPWSFLELGPAPVTLCITLCMCY